MTCTPCFICSCLKIKRQGWR